MKGFRLIQNALRRSKKTRSLILYGGIKNQLPLKSLHLFPTHEDQGGAMSQTPLNTTAFSAKILKKVRYTHDAMIDLIISNPEISEIELGEAFGYSKQWVSRLMCSDAFQARLALRREEIIDPKLTATVEERLRGVALESLKIIQDGLIANPTFGNAMKAAELTLKAGAYGARNQNPVVNNTFVVALPDKIPNEKDWESKYAREPVTIDHENGE
jgi:hypothetical protein